MDSMFDRLGDLLSGTLEGNPIFEENDFLQRESVEHLAKKETEFEKIDSDKKISQTQRIKEKAQNVQVNEFFVPYHLKSEFSLLGITTLKTTESEIKTAFKEKIKFFHPDKQKNIPVLQKIATDRTAQIVEAYKKIQDWLSSRAVL